MAALVLGLEDRITLVPTDAADPADSLRHENPLGKYPCLIREDGDAVYDSSVILEFLQDVAGTDRLIPTAGPDRIAMLTRTRLADGIIDAGALIIYEERYHETTAQSQVWLAHQRGKILRALTTFDSSLPRADVTDALSIGLSCALGFLDRRSPLNWRADFPKLACWLHDFESAEPSFQRTAPAAIES